MIIFKQLQFSEEDKSLFLEYLGKLDGFLVRCKNLHWAAPKRSIHVYLDEFHELLSGYQDAIAEGYMGILGQMGPTDVVFQVCHSNNALDFLDEVIDETKSFYEILPDSVIFKGISGEVESFIQNCNKYKYLFSIALK